MSRPTVLLLGMDDAQQADLRLALKDVANVVRSKTPAELIADEYRSLNPGRRHRRRSVATTPQRFGLIHNIAAAGGVVIVVSPTQGSRADPARRCGPARASSCSRAITRSCGWPCAPTPRSPSAGGEHRSGGHHLRRQGGRRLRRRSPSTWPGRCSAAALRVCLVDLDLHLGDVLSFLDVAGNYSITDVLANMSRLDRELLATSVTKHRSGVSVLAQSSKVEEAEQIKGAGRRGAAGVPAPQLRLRDRRRRARASTSCRWRRSTAASTSS